MDREVLSAAEMSSVEGTYQITWSLCPNSRSAIAALSASSMAPLVIKPSSPSRITGGRPTPAGRLTMAPPPLALSEKQVVAGEAPAAGT